MKILSIETSCDETAVSVLDANGNPPNGGGNAEFIILGNALFSQAHLHAPYGGVYPNLAKREHARNILPLLEAALKQAGMYSEKKMLISEHLKKELSLLLEREATLAELFLDFVSHIGKPAIDAVVVTQGPGLEPALWVGVNFAKALSLTWEVPLVPSNHLEGHLVASLTEKTSDDVYTMKHTLLPLLGLLISGGHTEFALANEWMHFTTIGQTRDDAVGEAFDKVARLLDLPYPGGIHVSRLAEKARRNAYRVVPGQSTVPLSFPRPMLKSPDLDFSFSGLKTAVLYFVRSLPQLNDYQKGRIALEFEDAVADVIVEKSKRALTLHNARSFVIGGGVSANATIRKRLEILTQEQFPNVKLFLPSFELTTDNAVMIGMAGYFRALEMGETPENHAHIRAEGSLKMR